MDFQEIIYQFFPKKIIKEVKPFGNGHIHSTFKVKLENEAGEFILQKINTQVFVNHQDMIRNHTRLQEYLNTVVGEIEIPVLISTTSNRFLFQDTDKNIWRLMNYIENSYSLEVVTNENQAYEAGKGFGWFARMGSNLESSEFVETIKDFHRLSFRIKQFNDALKSDNSDRYKLIKPIVDFFKKREAGLLRIEKLVDTQQIPLRVVHNDTKINNLLFRNEKAVAVIDLDTVGPGSVLYDYGDAIRTIANTAAEDEQNLTIVDFSLDAFDAFTKGYLNETKSILNAKEKELLHCAPILMAFIMGIRFLTDYLNGDIYYKTSFAEHNLVRGLVQKRFIELLELHEAQMKIIIEKYLK